jgi:hypothetical protein
MAARSLGLLLAREWPASLPRDEGRGRIYMHMYSVGVNRV